MGSLSGREKGFLFNMEACSGGVRLCVMGMYVIMGSIFNKRVWVGVVLLCHHAYMKTVLSLLNKVCVLGLTLPLFPKKKNCL